MNDSLFVYILPIVNPGTTGQYVRITDNRRLAEATEPGERTLNLDEPSDEEWPDGLGAELNDGRLQITHSGPAETTVQEHGQVPLAMNEIAAIQDDVVRNFLNSDEEPPRRTFDEFMDMLPGLLPGEYALGWDTDDKPISRRLFEPDKTTPSFLIQYPESAENPEDDPARRMLNAIAAQALHREVAVFAPDWALGLCRGSDDPGRVRPLSDVESWYQQTNDDPAIVVVDDGALRALFGHAPQGLGGLAGGISGGVLKDDRLIVFGRNRHEDDRADEHRFYTHTFYSYREEDSRPSHYVNFETYDRFTCFSAPNFPVQPPH